MLLANIARRRELASRCSSSTCREVSHLGPSETTSEQKRPDLPAPSCDRNRHLVPLRPLPLMPQGWPIRSSRLQPLKAKPQLALPDWDGIHSSRRQSGCERSSSSKLGSAAEWISEGATCSALPASWLTSRQYNCEKTRVSVTNKLFYRHDATAHFDRIVLATIEDWLLLPRFFSDEI